MSEQVIEVSPNSIFFYVYDKEFIRKLEAELKKLGIKTEGKVVWCG